MLKNWYIFYLLQNTLYSITQADVTYWYLCANQKHIGSCNKKLFCLTRYKFE